MSLDNDQNFALVTSKKQNHEFINSPNIGFIALELIIGSGEVDKLFNTFSRLNGMTCSPEPITNF